METQTFSQHSLKLAVLERHSSLLKIDPSGNLMFHIVKIMPCIQMR